VLLEARLELQSAAAAAPCAAAAAAAATSSNGIDWSSASGYYRLNRDFIRSRSTCTSFDMNAVAYTIDNGICDHRPSQEEHTYYCAHRFRLDCVQREPAAQAPDPHWIVNDSAPQLPATPRTLLRGLDALYAYEHGWKGNHLHETASANVDTVPLHLLDYNAVRTFDFVEYETQSPRAPQSSFEALAELTDAATPHAACFKRLRSMSFVGTSRERGLLQAFAWLFAQRDANNTLVRSIDAYNALKASHFFTTNEDKGYQFIFNRSNHAELDVLLENRFIDNSERPDLYARALQHWEEKSMLSQRCAARDSNHILAIGVLAIGTWYMTTDYWS
jgi:hypothetical protein